MKIRQLFGSMGLILALSVSANLWSEVTPEQAAQFRVEIKQLVDNYAIYRDRKDGEGYANQFSEDGKFLFGGQVYQGREVLQKRIEAADPNNTTMHIMSSGQITFIDDQNAIGVHYATVYSEDTEEPRKEGEMLSVTNFGMVGIYHDKYVHTSEGWKIAERSFERVLKGIK